jgi:PBSX family phage terminase large subunit
MLLTPCQKIIAKDNHRFRVANCGRRFGKTVLAAEEIKGKAIADECRIAYIAPTYGQARDIIWQSLIKELKEVSVKINESRLEIEVHNLKGTTSLIQLRGWESVETLRGQKFHLLVIDEVAMMRNFWLNWQEVLIPTLTDTKGEVLFTSTPKGFNHFYELYQQELSNLDWKSFHFTTYDNPYIEQSEIDKLKTQMTDDRFAQEYEAQFKRTEGIVYKEFNRDLDITEKEPLRVNKTILGLDFGYTNPTAILKIDIDQDNTYWIREEWYKTGQTNEQIAEKALSFKSTVVYPDPAEPDRISALTRLGLNCREVSKDISAGIDSVRELFKQRRIKIHPSCKNLLFEIETYSYPDKKPDQNEKEVPIKENDHALDALRYALYSYRPSVNILNQLQDKQTFK